MPLLFSACWWLHGVQDWTFELDSQVREPSRFLCTNFHGKRPHLPNAATSKPIQDMCAHHGACGALRLMQSGRLCRRMAFIKLLFFVQSQSGHLFDNIVLDRRYLVDVPPFTMPILKFGHQSRDTSI